MGTAANFFGIPIVILIFAVMLPKLSKTVLLALMAVASFDLAGNTLDKLTFILINTFNDQPFRSLLKNGAKI